MKKKYEAVIFDLGGTLIRSTPWSEYVEEAKKVADAVAAPVDDFVRIWFEQSAGLGTGVFPSFQAFIQHVSRQLSLEVPSDLLDRAADISISLTKRYVTVPRDGAIEVLSYLKANGYRTGLITDCSPDVPALWPETPFAPYFDVTVFSCNVGTNKAEPRILKIALDKLAVKPQKCMYIADGMRNELANAKSLGMHSIRLVIPGEDDDSPIREDWRGQTISSLKEVLDFLT